MSDEERLAQRWSEAGRDPPARSTRIGPETGFSATGGGVAIGRAVGEGLANNVAIGMDAVVASGARDSLVVGDRGLAGASRVTVLGANGFSHEEGALVLAAGGQQVVVHQDGRVVLPPGWTPDAGARAFWQAVGDARRTMTRILPQARTPCPCCGES